MRLSFPLGGEPEAPYAETPLLTPDGAIYSLVYRVEQRGLEWWAVLDMVHELMPPKTPQLLMYPGVVGRLQLDVIEDEIAQRKKEWAEINEAASRRVMITGN